MRVLTVTVACLLCSRHNAAMVRDAPLPKRRLLGRVLVCALGLAWTAPLRSNPALTLNIENPSGAQAQVFRVVPKRRMEPHGVLHAAASMHVTTYPGQRWAVFFGCRKPGYYFRVPDRLTVTWKLPRHPCRR